MKKVLLLVVVVASLIVGTTSCKKAKDATDKAGEAVEQAAEKTTEAVKGAADTAKEGAEKVTDAVVGNVVKLELAGNDAMKFDKSEFKVKAGQKITLTLKHTGKMKKTIMGHNFVLLKQGTDIPKFAEKAMAAKANDYIPSEGVIAHTKTIGGGESTSVTFTAPAKGIYDFICSYPGHYGMMKGKFIVE